MPGACARLAIEQAFVKTSLETMVACIKPAHKASLKLLGRCGLEPINLAPHAHEGSYNVPLMPMLMTQTRWAWLHTESISGWLPDPIERVELTEGPPRMPAHMPNQ